MIQKAIIFDSSTLISFAMNGILDILRDLKKEFSTQGRTPNNIQKNIVTKGRSFLITPDVKREVIDRPITITRFKLEALKIQGLLDEGVLELANYEGMQKKTKEILDIANSIFMGRDKEIKLISSGEASCLALSRLLTEKKIMNVVAVDERTTRMLVENPENLGKFLEKKMHTKIDFKKDNFEIFKNFKVIRSAELVYIAHKKKLVKIGNGKLLDALLWAVKFKGCSISNEEINEMKKLG